MIFIYNFFLILLSIVFLPVILIAFIIQPKFRAGFFKKIGFYKFNNIARNKRTILIHAVSVGEVNAVEELVKKIRMVNPEDNIVLTTTTKTGQEIAIKKLSNVVNEITYFPYDFCFSVNAFLKALKPDIVIIAETEIWPMFSYLTNKAKINLYIVNGRISPHSYNGYKKISFFVKGILNKYTKILAQTEGDAQRIISIGANEQIVKNMGNLKFDISKNLDNAQIQNLKNELQTQDKKILVVGSTHKGEDEILINAFCKLNKKDNSIKMLIAPRHPQRFEQVENLIKQTNLAYSKRSLGGNFNDNAIIMLDTMGELAKIYSICDVAFIGGSYVNTGGHNPLEASIWDKPVISGPVVFNFKDIYKFLTQNEGCVIANDEKELDLVLDKMFFDNEYYQKIANNAKLIFEQNRGAIDFAIKEIFLN